MLTAALLVVFPFAMLFAAASDLVSMTIANRVPVVLSLAFLVLASLGGLAPSAIAMHALVGTLVLCVTFGCFAAGWMGGGDAKLMAATALWFGPTLDLMNYLLLGSILGGALTLCLLSARAHLVPVTGVDFMDRLLDDETGIPYGIALGAAGLMTYSSSPWMTLALSAAY